MPSSTPSVQASTATTRTSAAAAALVPSTDVPRVLGSSNVSPIAGDECRETTAGTMPLHDPVARDAGEGKPAVLVGSTAPSAGGERHAILEPRPVITQVEGDRSTPKNLPISDQENTNIGQSDHDERRNVCHFDLEKSMKDGQTDPNQNNYVPIAPRQVVELSTTLIASRPDTDMTTPPIQELSYASVLQAAVEKTHGGEVKATLVRPSRVMLARLMELADDDTTTDEEMMQAIKEARPYTDREAKGTFWIETGDALASQSNDKIIKSLLGDNKDATWGHLMAHFLQVNKARGGDVVVTVADESARLGMLDQEVHILGSVYTVATPKTKSPRAPHSKQQDDLHDLYYLDIVGTRPVHFSLPAKLDTRNHKLHPNPMRQSGEYTSVPRLNRHPC
ncbi:Aste57867_4902 [Aphanomyces stellatus]|uniref:Aste57867_4902 protein n=1 Tax=Aphanomyces stellatus TaxID=120398 RepID=A0A485KDL5_9STRA|nr:hypothetical protein As57867_004889 [Aphanomyces stellatus]VFT81994.1 Aste57867_4902 [Aphanomyces stellatus]